MGVDWKDQLSELYKRHSKNKKDKKPGAAAAKDNLENFRNIVSEKMEVVLHSINSVISNFPIEDIQILRRIH